MSNTIVTSDLKENQSIDIKNALEKLLELKWFKEVFEWTFAYDAESKNDQTPYNTTYFQDIWWVSYKDYKQRLVSSEELINFTKENLLNYKNKLLEIKKELEKKWNDEKTKIEIEGIDYMILSLDSAISSVEVELEKAWKYKLTDERREELEAETERTQILLYWSNIEDSTEEIDMTFKLMCEEFFDNKKYLTKEEQEEYIDIFNQISKSFLDKWKIDIVVPDIKTYKYKKAKRHNLSKEVLETWKQIRIGKKDYMKIWQLGIFSNWLSHIVEEDPNLSSIYDWPKILWIPSSKNYDTKILKEVLMLFQHEINSHYINQKISENAWFQVRWANNIEKEEWLAVIEEKLLEWYKLEDMLWAWIAYPYVLATQNLDEKTRTRFINLRMKLLSQGKNDDKNKWRELRIKRWFSMNSKRCQFKDLSYTRWKNKILRLIKSWKFNLVDFYKWKFSIEDVVSWRLDKVIKNEDIVYPNFFTDLLIFLIWKKDWKVKHDDFIKFLKEKYKWDIPEKYLNSINTVSMDVRRKFVEILKIIPQFSLIYGEDK